MSNLFWEINIWAILVSSVKGFFLGSIIYANPIISPAWLRLVNLKEEEIKDSNFLKIYATTFGIIIFMCTAVGVMINLLEGFSIFDSLLIISSIFFMFNVLGYLMNIIYQRKKILLWSIDSSYQLSIIIIACLIQYLWK